MYNSVIFISQFINYLLHESFLTIDLGLIDLIDWLINLKSISARDGINNKWLSYIEWINYTSIGRVYAYVCNAWINCMLYAICTLIMTQIHWFIGNSLVKLLDNSGFNLV